ncbi:MAG: LysE family translocator [Desulfovibrionaceae bacterium]
MTLTTYLAFLAAAAVVLAAPGPTILYVLGVSVGRGARAGLATVPGVVAGDMTAMSLSLAGVGAALSVSAELFTVLRMAGAAVLIWLGIQAWRKAGRLDAGRSGASDRWVAGKAFAVTALNPKSIVFFVAFLPQFISPHDPYLPQAFLLGGSFLVLAGVNAACYALLAGSLSRFLQGPVARRRLGRTGAGVLVAAGVWTAAKS